MTGYGSLQMSQALDEGQGSALLSVLGVSRPECSFRRRRRLQCSWKGVSWGFVVLLFLACCCARASMKDRNWHSGLDEFFKRVDIDGDGQVGPTEAMRFIGDNLGATGEAEMADAVTQMTANLDSTDHGDTISEAEVEAHLRKLMQGHRVAEWIKHGLGLPQYVDTFKANAITALDFPMLVNDNGETLRTDLGISSRLHRQQIMRAIQRVILGLGSPPSKPRGLTCTALTCDSIAVRWRSPEKLGSPPMHKYKLERRKARDSKWVTANGDVDDEEEGWLDSGLPMGEYEYRLTAWNTHGWSDFAFSPVCTTANASLPCTSPAACLELENCLDDAQPLPVSASARAKGRDSLSLLHGLFGGTVGGIFGSLGVLLLTTLALRHCPKMYRHIVGWLRKMEPEGEQERTTADSSLRNGGLSLSTLPSLASTERGSQPPVPAVRNVTFRTEAGSSGHHTNEIQYVNGGSTVLQPALHGLGNGMLNGAGLHAVGNGTAVQAGDMRGQRGEGATMYHSAPVPHFRSTSNLSAASGPQARTKVDLWLRDTSGISSRHNLQEFPSSSSLGELEVEETVEHDMQSESSDFVDRHRCAFPGCHRRFGRLRLSDIKYTLQRHYCALCQKVYCHHHTAYSPHGPLVGCDLESKCICVADFAMLSAATQERLAKTNKIVHRDKSRPGAGSVSDPNAQQPSRMKLWGMGFFGFGSSAGGSSREASGLTETTAGAESSDPSSRLESSDSAGKLSGSSASGARRAKRHWAVAGTAVKSVVRFRLAGTERQRRRSRFLSTVRE